MKILLVSIPIEFPLASYCLAAQLSASPDTADCAVQLLNLDATQLNNYDKKTGEVWRYIARVEAWRPDLICFSVYLWNHLSTHELVSITRRLYPATAIVVGGPELATPEAAEPWLVGADVRAVVRGEGELTLVEIVSRLRGGGRLRGVRGCSWRDGSSTVHEPSRPPVSDLSELASPYLIGLVPDQLFRTSGDSGRRRRGQFPRAFLETYRGCYMQCSYCQWGNGTKSRSSFPLSRVRGELSWILARRVDHLWIVDAMFGFKKQLAKDILRHIIDEKAAHGATTRVGLYHNQDFFDPELLDLYREADVTVEVDLQSTDEAVLTRVGRAKWSTESFERHLDAFRDQNVPTTGGADLIIGLPKDNLETFARSVDYLLERDMHVNLYQTSIIPDTPMSRSVQEDGIVFSEIPPRAVLRNSTFSTAEMITARLMGHGVEFFTRFPHVAQLLWRRRFARPSEFCLHIGQLLWDRYELMYSESNVNSPGLDGVEDLIPEILPELCPDDWLLPAVRELFALQSAALNLLAPARSGAASHHPCTGQSGYRPGDEWLSDRPRLRREAVREVRLERRVDRLLQTWFSSGVMPSDEDWRSAEAEPAMALVYLHERREPRYRIVDLDVTCPLLRRFTGDFTIAECLDSLGRQLGRTWHAEELAEVRERLSILARLGLLETELRDPSRLNAGAPRGARGGERNVDVAERRASGG